MYQAKDPIDVQRLDASVLYEGEIGGSPVANIVFVHGLCGDPRKTWRWRSKAKKDSTRTEQRSARFRYQFKGNPDAKSKQFETQEERSTFWPADILPQAVPDARILTYGYNADVVSGIFHGHNKNSILQHGNDLMVKIERSLRNDKPVIFVAHSLGGLVVKNAIQRCKSSLDSRYQKLFSRIYGVVFCGTPHRGSPSATWAEIASNLAVAALRDVNTRLLRDLQVDSQILDLIQDEFLKLLYERSIKVHTFQEGRGLSGVQGFTGKIVDDFSSKVGYALETVEVIDANHREMVKFENDKDAGFKALSDVLFESLREIKEQHESAIPAEYYDYRLLFRGIDYFDHRRKVPKRHGKTCEWLTQTEPFHRWYHSEAMNIFWLHGYPGLGKSVMANFIHDYLVENGVPNEQRHKFGQGIACYFFCLESDTRTQHPTVVLGSIIHQILSQDLRLARALHKDQIFSYMEKSDTRSVWKLWSILTLLISEMDFRPLYITIDGLDEMKRPELETFLEDLTEFAHGHPSTRLFLTSRPEPEIQAKLAQDRVVMFNLGESKNSRTDVSAFLTDTVESYALKHSFDVRSKDRLLSALSERSDGLFLWATLAWQHFITGAGPWSRAKLQKRITQLKELPRGMDALYYRILSSVSPGIYADLKHILRWIVVARRPLTLAELSVAHALKENPETCEDLESYKTWSMNVFLEEHCPYLVKIDKRNSIVSMVHQSFKDFLLQATEVVIDQRKVPNKFYIDFHDADSESGCECLTFIGLADFRVEAVLDDKVSFWLNMDAGLLEKYTFLSYARLYWADHVRSKDHSDEVWRAFVKTIQNGPNYKILCMTKDSYRKRPFDPPIFTAFKNGLKALLVKLVVNGYDINERDGEGNQVLHHCDLSPSSPDVEFLLDLGADINGRDLKGQTMLMRLVRSQFVQSVQLWLQKPGVDVNAQDNEGSAPLHAVVLLEVDLAIMLLDLFLSHPQIDINIRDNQERTPLTLAIHWGREKVTRILIGKANTKLDAARERAESPLINAARQGWTETLLGILKQLKIVDGFVDSDGQSILHWTVKQGMIEALTIALNKQTTLINSADNKGMTALHLAAEEGDYESVKLLMNKGGDISRKTAFGALPLHLAARQGHTPIVEFLLEYTSPSTVNDRDSLGCTIAHWATTSGNDGLIQFLTLRRDVDLALKDNKGRTPVALTAEHASVEALKAMLDTTHAQIDQLDYFGNTLLHLAAGMDNKLNALYLINSRGIDKNAQNHFGKTALDKAAAVSKESSLYLGLVEAGCQHSPMYSRQMLLAAERSKQERVDRDAREKRYNECWSIVPISRSRASPPGSDFPEYPMPEPPPHPTAPPPFQNHSSQSSRKRYRGYNSTSDRPRGSAAYDPQESNSWDKYSSEYDSQGYYTRDYDFQGYKPQKNSSTGYDPQECYSREYHPQAHYRPDNTRERFDDRYY